MLCGLNWAWQGTVAEISDGVNLFSFLLPPPKIEFSFFSKMVQLMLRALYVEFPLFLH